MRLPTIRRRSLPIVAGGGLVAVCVAVAVVIAGLSGGHDAQDGRDGIVAGAQSQASRSPAGQSPAGQSPASGAPGAAQGTAAGTDGAATGALHGASASPGAQPGGGLSGGTPTHLVVPDVIATAPGGVTAADLAKIRKLSGVRAVLAIDGAQIKVNGSQLTVLAAEAAALRPWTPPATAASTPLWSAFQAGALVTTSQAAARAGLAAGRQYPVAAGVSGQIADGGTALLGVAGVDGVVSQAEGNKLGLVKNVAVLVNAPAADMSALAGQVKAALGASARVVVLVPVSTPGTSLPVDTSPGSGRPTSYLGLFQASAARYCPGLSWTVLAAIGQIESADGQNVGPSTAGALGPMQFLPSTWATWGIDGFGDTGSPDIMNPFDAVPSAARLLCADGAATSQGLRQAIFDYNHADWYVDEVLTLAEEYAREFS